MIQVLIAEVSLDETDQFGVELGLQDSVLFDRSLLQDLEITTNRQTVIDAGGGSNTFENEIIQSADLIPGFNFGAPGQPLGHSGSDRSGEALFAIIGQYPE